ncbi:putative ligand-gated chloride channel-like 3 isoform X1 [Penaeus vannamei]|uniref:Putative ligand-gated chloride channel-like 3 isoform X1 n=1 Tax=Penaeus vannamei TaxID=6689 RepID=A0A3R7PUC9_PENVA|nr:putative ligand-gated chloride channel-like 3 isoform X1 [Penaeus vannamei]
MAYNRQLQYGFPDFNTDVGLHQWTHFCHVFSIPDVPAYVGGEVRAQHPSWGRNVLWAAASTGRRCFRGYIRAGGHLEHERLKRARRQELAACPLDHHRERLLDGKRTTGARGVSVSEEDLPKLCQKNDRYVIFPEMRDLKDSQLMCKRVGCQVYAPDSTAKNLQLHAISRQFSDTCFSNFHLWLGLSDEGEENVWRKFSDDSVVGELSFASDQPNGARGENCVFMSLIDGSWSDTYCLRDWKSCVPCERDGSRPLRLRGLCAKKELETEHEVLGYEDGKPYFHGIYGTIIFQKGLGHWELFDSNLNETVATVALVHRDAYPLGRHEWLLHSSVCNRPKGSSVVLGLSTCNDTEFMCSSGDCIHKKLRCNSKDDCADLSDEQGCTLIDLPRSYRKERPPEGSAHGEPIELDSTVEILRFVTISDVNRLVRLELNVEITWQDPRLKFLNLKDVFEWNRLTAKEADTIWRPRLEFPNVFDGNVKLLKEGTYIRKIGEQMDADMNDVNMDTVYRGDSAVLIQQQHYSGSFACSFDVFYYPFDTQRCSVLLQLSFLRLEVAKFAGERARVEYLEDKELPSYIVTRYHATDTYRGNNDTRYSVLKVEFELDRRWTVIVMAVFFPTSMLLIIGYSTLFVKVSLLQVRLIVSLTTLLVLYTLFNNTSDALPPTAYVKMIDVWFFSCILLLFFVIISHVVVEHLENRSAGVTWIRPIENSGSKNTGKKVLSVPRHQLDLPDRVLVYSRLLVVPVLIHTYAILQA